MGIEEKMFDDNSLHALRRRTMMPAPRCPMRLVVDFSMMRTGTPFWARVSAATSPEGPDPI